MKSIGRLIDYIRNQKTYTLSNKHVEAHRIGPKHILVTKQGQSIKLTANDIISLYNWVKE